MEYRTLEWVADGSNWTHLRLQGDEQLEAAFVFEDHGPRGQVAHGELNGESWRLRRRGVGRVRLTFERVNDSAVLIEFSMLPLRYRARVRDSQGHSYFASQSYWSHDVVVFDGEKRKLLMTRDAAQRAHQCVMVADLAHGTDIGWLVLLSLYLKLAELWNPWPV